MNHLLLKLSDYEADPQELHQGLGQMGEALIAWEAPKRRFLGEKNQPLKKMENIASGKPHLVFLSLAKPSPSENSCGVICERLKQRI